MICIYDQLRTVHLERAARSVITPQILYHRKSYDFDQRLAISLSAKRLGIIQQVILLIKHPYDVLEINEPMFLRALPYTIILVFVARVSRLLSAKPPAIVSYAIENVPITTQISDKNIPFTRVLQFLLKTIATLLFRQIDRVAFGTPSALVAYQHDLDFTSMRTNFRIILGLEPACTACEEKPKRRLVLFVGSFESRKGITQLIKSWRELKHKDHTVEVCFAGKGELQAEVQQYANMEGAEVVLDPSRAKIHELQAMAKVLVLPSVPQRGWREQIGLPILEGLSHGCEIVTTSTNGMAPWLQKHGHRVVRDAHDIGSLAEAQLSAVNDRRTPAEILADLPAISGRLQAQNWLWQC